MHFAFYTDEGGVSLKDIVVGLEAIDGIPIVEIPLAAVLSVCEEDPMLSRDFVDRFFAASRKLEKRKRLERNLKMNNLFGA